MKDSFYYERKEGKTSKNERMKASKQASRNKKKVSRNL
jgi:hypothetical protein